MPVTEKLKLEENEIHLWITSPNNITSSDLLSKYYDILTEEEIIRQKKFYFAKHQHQYLVTRAMVKTALSYYENKHPADWEFSKNKYGRPEIANSDVKKKLRFNLSHTDDLIICGITLEKDIGVDVENVSRNGQTIEIADRFFSRNEVNDLLTLPIHQQRNRFFDYWVLKESYIKACGMGLSIPLNQFSFKLRKNSPISISFEPERNDFPLAWKFWLFNYFNSHKIALAIRSHPSTQNRVLFYSFVPFGDFQIINHLSNCHPI